MKSPRSKILHTATALFAERGYPGATVQETASAAGVTPGTVYRLFGGRERLFEACVKKALAAQVNPETFKPLLCLRPQGPDFRALLRNAVHQWYVGLPRSAARLLAQAGFCTSGKPGPVDAIAQLLSACLERELYCSSTVNAELAARMLVYSLFHLKLFTASRPCAANPQLPRELLTSGSSWYCRNVE